MALYKRGSVWWMSFQYGGRHVQKSTRCKNKRDAEAVTRAFHTQLAKGEVGIETKAPAPAFDKALKEFFEFVKDEGVVKESTQNRNETSSKALLRYFKKTRIDRIEKKDVEAFRNMRRKQNRNNPKNKKGNERTVRPATINRELCVLKKMCNFYIERRVLTFNPVKGVKFLDNDNQQMRVMTDAEERLYLLAARQPLKDLAILMLDCGMRPEEICRIERGNVSLEKRTVFVPNGKTKAARRLLPLTNRAVEVLKKRMEEISGQYLFPVEDDKRIKHKFPHIIRVNAQHDSAVRRSGIAHARLYDLRHTFATRVLEAGCDLVTLAALLGHANINMIMRYAHPSESHKNDAVAKMEQRRAAV